MSIRQREPGRAVIKIGRLPGNCGVATGARRNREQRWRRGVLGVGGLLPGRQMALRIAAIGRLDGQVVIIVDMAGSARNVGVSVGQGKSGRAVVEFCSQPAIKGVAGVAGLRKLRRNVIRVGGFLKIRQVTRIAGRGQSQVLANRRALVAIIALHRGVRTQQWKTILVVL